MARVLLRARGLLGSPQPSPCYQRGPRFLSSPSSSRLSFSTSPHLTSSFSLKKKDAYKLPETPCRTRFAPSPTGFMHLGSLRTALYNYLLARATGGQFILRIEDTDRTRLVPGAEQKLFEDLEWAGLLYDEGPDKGGPYGPYRQSERLPLYKKHADQLIREGKAYRCFCSPSALDELRRTAHESGLSTNYPGTCRDISLEESDERASRGEPFAVRFKSGEKPLVVQDFVYRRFRNQNPEEDFVILKRDGFPTYHFANVVDDHHMKITHVIRGAEWLISTPKHVEMYQAFGWEPPQFGHIGLLVDKKRQKLSKRDKSANLAYYQDHHVLPEALLNYLVFLGWRAPQGKDGVLTLQEMVDNFTTQFSKGDIIASQSKLRYLQNQHLKNLVSAEPKTPAQAARVDQAFVAPIRAAVEQAKRQPPDPAHEDLVGPELPEPRILTDPRYAADLFRLTYTTKDFASHAPAELAADAVARVRYFVWSVPRRVLEAQLGAAGRLDALFFLVGSEGAAGGAGEVTQVTQKQRQQLARPVARALAMLRARAEELDEARWEGAALKEVLEKAAADDEYLALFGLEAEPAESEEGKSKAKRSTPQALNQHVWVPLRWALVASEKGLPIANTMEVLGREESLRRLKVAEEAAENVASEHWVPPTSAAAPESE
ncbi:hypothetical protein VTJ83DRAFT_888 [Remersonia thermophila]|uniref:glutamate--tRNA ligase n=1 Tax=Remersonia thermophila TaxID=72144 RepID=A0ABR4DP13_9PEZI